MIDKGKISIISGPNRKYNLKMKQFLKGGRELSIMKLISCMQQSKSNEQRIQSAKLLQLLTIYLISIAPVQIKNLLSMDIVLFIQQLCNKLCKEKTYYKSIDKLFQSCWINRTCKISRFRSNAVFLLYTGCYLLFVPVLLAQENARLSSSSLLRGEVRAALNGQAIEGASVTVNKQTVNTDKDGKFIIRADKPTGILTIKHIGFKERSVAYENMTTFLKISLQPVERLLEEVEVVSTGYQKIPKVRATGSFVQIDNDLLNRKISTNIIDRLDGVAGGVLFDKNQVGNNQAFASIRGRSTLFADPNPLIVVDNFPFQGDINTLNPNDVESITILKDAAAASIWGAKSGNGVIVIQTKAGRFNKKTQIQLNSNITISEKPDLFYRSQLSSTEYIELQEFLFERGYYAASLRNDYSYIPQAVDVFQKRKLGTISEQEALSRLDQLRNTDVRNDLLKYMYTRGGNQQYALNISGGTDRSHYYISGGYDNNVATLRPNSSDRKTLNMRLSNGYLQNKLELTLNLGYSYSTDKSTGSSYSPLSPYDRIVDVHGNPLALPNSSLRADYADTVGRGVLLDWSYRPLEDMNKHNALAKERMLRSNIVLTYRPMKQLDVSLLYQYTDQKNDRQLLAESNSYYARDLINRYTQIDKVTGAVKYPVPLGAILDRSDRYMIGNYGRFQSAYNQLLFDRLQVNAIAGFEISEDKFGANSYRYYGYNPETGVNANSTMNFIDPFPLYYNPTSSSRLPTGASESGGVDRYLSYYANTSVDYDQKYVLTISARKDASNLFGVSSNQKGVPLWSTGLLWNLHNESFFGLKIFNKLQLRTTYGYTGNVDKSVSALLTSTVGKSSSNGINQWGSYYTEIMNPPNPSLRWEKIKKINTGINFGLWKDRIVGGLDYYYHDGIDLIGDSPIAPQTGLTKFRGNSARVKTKGVDISITSRNIKFNEFEWSSSWLFNWIKDKVVRYEAAKGSNRTIVESNWSNPLVGYPYNSVFSFPSRGLDSLGLPIGELDGESSSNYSAILNQVDPTRIKYHGSGSPRYFGSWRNDFRWRAFNLSFNLTYKMDYYFRRRNVFNGNTYGFAQEGYADRWQKPGDEQSTYIPALIYPMNASRSTFFNYAEVLIERGDHIRLQDIQFSYDIKFNKRSGQIIPRIQVYGYINNIAVLWRANKLNIDPNSISSSPAPRTWSIGMKANF
ncbi:SusC/RagA family TonB-linked outer membrane protein [Sphingobacterium puteale]|uniref:SusC/RagA family TonB-linked outer membrane protein n=2 Tax=Sphingobacterium puteale TaxID=2420510 RepID=A0A420W156_9SPHI|nr:SusC/RagA family TonB-linked outer membrane protein [Sphingobacterium puteale]